MTKSYSFFAKSYSFFDNAIVDANILANGEVFNKEERKEELIQMFSDCYDNGEVHCEGFKVTRVMSEDCTVTYEVNFSH